MRTPPPCKHDGIDCPKRRLGCREGCKDWNDWQQVHAKESAQILSQKRHIRDADVFLEQQQKRIRQARQRRYMQEKKEGR